MPDQPYEALGPAALRAAPVVLGLDPRAVRWASPQAREEGLSWAATDQADADLALAHAYATLFSGGSLQ
jgi:hypothetical protein